MHFFILSTLVMGAAGFSAGFFGPIMIEPGANQGPMLGIFITGPLGLVAGAVLGVVLPRAAAERQRVRILAAFAVVTFVGILAGIVCLRAPEFVGRLYFAEVTDQRPATELLPSAIEEWEDIARKNARAPQTGWQEDRSRMVQQAGGSVVTLKQTAVWYVYRQRQPWNKGRHTFVAQPAEMKRDAYIAPDVAPASPGWFLSKSHGVPAEWPPGNIGDFLSVVEVVSAPPEMRPAGK